jgi:uncharacterized protein YcbK (DUF882 family)
MERKQLTLNFNVAEFDCHDGTQVPNQYYDGVQLLATNLQALRDYLGEPVHVLCGYRTVKHNKAVGGAKASQHLVAKAADISVKSKTPKQLHKIIGALITVGTMKQGGLGLYPGFVHYDVRGRKARW